MRRILSALAGVALLVMASQSAFAHTIDLTTAAATGSAVGFVGGEFKVVQMDQQPTGTGVIKPFLRVQSNNTEGGYNTSDGGNMNFDAKAGIWTHALQLSAVPIVNIGGVNYRQFLLDINETNSSGENLLSLNQVQIFQGGADPGNGLTAHTGTSATDPWALNAFAGATEVFRMSGTGNFHEVLLDYNLNPGSGAGDMFLYVRDSAFNANLGSYVTFYSQFGDPGAEDSSDGFEEWAVLEGTTTTQVPEPSSLLLLGMGLVGSAVARVVKTRDSRKN
jgi:hypothetical protein